ncbi:MAG: hypothetical protein JWN45_2392, partial [Acidobacteriaceae bacterium]|nr:hypothetical protein [Acidobacteriaceae bacterium]
SVRCDLLRPYGLDGRGIHLIFIRCSPYAKMGISPPCVLLVTVYVATSGVASGRALPEVIQSVLTEEATQN